MVMRTATALRLDSAGSLAENLFSRSATRIWPPRNNPPVPPLGRKARLNCPVSSGRRQSLETPLDAEETAVGNPVSVRLKDPVKRNGRIVAPKGSVIQGRVTRAEHRSDIFLFRLSFESLDFDTGHADLRGRGIRCSVADALAPNSTFRGDTGENTMVFASNRLKFPRGFPVLTPK